jgi:two-component system sensor histidine kinase/response regulator
MTVSPAPITDSRSSASAGSSPPSAVRFSLLAIDDSPSDLDVLRRLVRKMPEWEVEFLACSEPMEAVALLDQRSVDVVLVDYRLGAITGLQLLEELRRSGFQGAIIVLTGQGDERVAAEAMRSGAADYMPKEDLSGANLRRAVSSALERSRLQIALTEHRKRLERANQDLQRRNTEIQSFYHTLSHELKTPLTAAREFVSILMEGLAGPLTPTQTEYLGYVKEGCDQMTVCMNDILDVTRMETGRLSMRPSPQDLPALVRRVAATLASRAQAAGIQIEQDIAPGIPETVFDPHRIAQVLSNLVDNALKFSPDGGRVKIRVGRDPSDAERISVSVEDTGKGIPPEHQANIFERLYQVRDGSEQSRMGLGLGLFICREIVRLHGGEISVQSEVGKGTTFTFTLPGVRVSQPANPEGSSSTHA